MKDYFECNLPLDAIHMAAGSEGRRAYREAAAKIFERTDKLNAALRMLPGWTGDEFQPLAAELFRNHPDRFDEMSAEEIAAYVASVYDGSPVEARIDWPNATVLFDTSFATNDEWVCIRHIGLGGSNTEVLGESSHKIPRQTFYDKTGTEMKAPEKKDPVPLVRGHFCEDSVIEAYTELTHSTRIPETRMFASQTCPHCIADVDGIIRTAAGDLLVFEAKTTIQANFGAWMDGKIPRDYLSQCHHYPAVLNDDRIVGTVISCMLVQDYAAGESFFGVAARGTNVTRFVERDLDIEADLLRAKEDFWNEYIAVGVLPPDSGEPDKEIDVLNQLSGYDPASEIKEWAYDDECKELMERYNSAEKSYKAAKAVSDQAKTARDEIQKEIIARLGDAPAAWIDKGDGSVYAIKYKPPEPTDKVNLETLKLAYRDAYDACHYVETGSRRFYLSEKRKSAWERDMGKLISAAAAVAE